MFDIHTGLLLRGVPKADMVTNTCDSNTWETVINGSEV